LKTLPPSQRGAIVLRYYFGADYSEIATALSLRENSVSKTLTRARDSLRRELA
jgi:RNA polymerase sigma factor (sigma-70 family)